MKNKIIIYLSLIAVGILVGAGVLYFFSSNNNESAHVHDDQNTLYTCGMHPNIIEEEPGTCPICGMNLTPIKNSSSGRSNNFGERNILYWRAPMDPNEIYDEPGKSKMGMDLVPVYDDEGSSQGVVIIDGSVIQNMNVKTEVVKSRTMNSSIHTNGILTTDERKEYVITTKISGWVEKLYVNFIGQEVKKGEKLIDIYSPELVVAQQELISAIEMNEKTQNISGDAIVKNAINKLKFFDISKAAIDKIISSQKVEKYLTLYAPFSGTVLTKNIVQGEKIKEGMELIKIANLGELWLKADIYESELNRIELGAPADITFGFKPGEVYEGKVSFIYPTLDQQTRTATVRINIKNEGNELKPAMFGNVVIESKSKNDGEMTVIPETAVLRNGKKNIVVLALGKGQFKPVEVTLGNYADGYYEILTGLKPNDRIVTSGQFMIDSESSLRAAVNMYSKEEMKNEKQETIDEKQKQKSEKKIKTLVKMCQRMKNQL